MSETTAMDPHKMEAFIGKVLGDTGGFAAIVMANLGDQLGLFKDLAANGPATSAELATRRGLHERYVREWLHGMRAAGYLEYSADSGRFAMPAEHVIPLATDYHPFFFGGVHQMLLDMTATTRQLPDAFRNGGGVHQREYGAGMWEGLERSTGSFFESRMLQEAIPAMPEVRARLEAGVRVADIGCGAGRAMQKLATAFPNSQFTGYDIFPPAVERAQQNAQAAGLADRLRYIAHDAAKGLPEPYDIITTFDVVHDSPDPQGLLRAIRQALNPGGTYIMLEINCADEFTDNNGPLATTLYGLSLMYCMTTSLAHGGVGLGTCGLPESKVREYCAIAGFSSVRRLPVEDAFAIIYEIKP